MAIGFARAPHPSTILREIVPVVAYNPKPVDHVGFLDYALAWREINDLRLTALYHSSVSTKPARVAWQKMQRQILLRPGSVGDAPVHVCHQTDIGPVMLETQPVARHWEVVVVGVGFDLRWSARSLARVNEWGIVRFLSLFPDHSCGASCCTIRPENANLPDQTRPAVEKERYFVAGA